MDRVDSAGSVVVDYMLQMAKNSTQLVDSVVKAIKESDETFAGSQVGSVTQSGEFTFVQTQYESN